MDMQLKPEDEAFRQHCWAESRLENITLSLLLSQLVAPSV